MQDTTCAVQVCLSLIVPFILSPASAASLGAFFSFSFSHLYSLFSFLHLQGCLQQSPGRQSYLEAQPVLLLSLGYVPAQTLGWSTARMGSTAPHAALPRHCQLWSLAGARQGQGGQERGTAGAGLYTGTRGGWLCVCPF